MNYFAIENNGEYYDHVILKDSDGNVLVWMYLDEYETMSDEEIDSYLNNILLK